MIPQVLCGHYPYVEIRSDIMVIRTITGGDSTGETGGGEAPGVQRRTVEDR